MKVLLAMSPKGVQGSLCGGERQAPTPGLGMLDADRPGKAVTVKI